MLICLTHLIKEFSSIITQLVPYNSSNLLYFFTYNVFEMAVTYITLFSESTHFCLRAQAVN